MPCASEKIIMAEGSGHISEYVNVTNVFHGVNSFFYTVHPMARILLEVVNVFRSENLPLFTLTSIQSIRKSTKNKNYETR